MVRDNLVKTVAQNEKQNQNHAPDEPARPQQVHNPESEKQKQQTEPDVRHWNKLHCLHLSDEELETWCQAEAASLPSHLRPFRSLDEYKLVKHTHHQLLHSSYYWGPMTMEEAHKTLSQSSPGTFLIRDSGQPDVFFTLSYQSNEGPISVRVMLNKLLFSLYGSEKTFPSLFALLAHYSSSSCKLTVPFRMQRPEFLKQICRRALVHTYGAENIRTLPGLSCEVKDYVQAYPHSL
ncbi:suppressor of cytokine signaling 1-like [Dunckerocampus dactyliophorus]|uniref:suppressor of cytokine signaling 1-like n=1 Tax=Dunckerocampus dactyliophorus TaxID=161453 RepID=UPI002405D4F4|nr:suppressor of cytokine signaling 1-like [Dunckerocampus dactyliophorus]